MKTKDGFEISIGMTVYDNWGEPREVTAFIGWPKPVSIYHNALDNKGFIQHVKPETVFGSQKNALNHHLQYITRKAWELEKEARQYRERETKAREQITELEKQEEISRQLENFENED